MPQFDHLKLCCKYLQLKRFYHTSFVVNSTNQPGVKDTAVDSSPKNKKSFFSSGGPDLKHFIKNSISVDDKQLNIQEQYEPVPYLDVSAWHGFNRKVYFDVYGCQMNVSDTEVVWSILKSAGFENTNSISEADIVLIVTCAIRENAENKIWERLTYLKGRKRARTKRPLKIGILGCMAERLKHSLIEKEKAVDLVAGPDSYRDLPRLLALTENNQTAVNVLLSLDETYADVVPVRLNEDSVSAFVSIMRGCDNMCTYCIVPFTRGRERSRPIDSIVKEIQKLSDEGVKEITLLGQNVNSYRDTSQESFSLGNETKMAKGFKTVYKTKKGGLRFADLLDKVSLIDPDMRIRFTSPHPKDFPDEMLQLISERSNICSHLHLPAQSGNSKVLERMRRGYTRESYLELVNHVYDIIPDVALSSDFICGFCGETEEEFQDTLTLIREVKYSSTFLFAYSMREKTTAHRRYKDDVPSEIKLRRLSEMNQAFREVVAEKNETFHGKVQLVLVEGRSKRSDKFLAGRNDGNVKVIFPSIDIPVEFQSKTTSVIKPGDYVSVKITGSSSQVLKGEPLYHSSIPDFNKNLCEQMGLNHCKLSL
ncbi:mitochondrial tRNA methylthiotransferase CDK5RAP1 isoform X1 [Lycorma delicatula]|uniref:mitochondrial tRNA methylthiotransferase CDK5RAP1 isoform X1 n=2 Tax=Lycorma delicatula TaxID=130591 RepID=UPI003F50D4B8